VRVRLLPTAPDDIRPTHPHPTGTGHDGPGMTTGATRVG
jgi:hypothetical protein